ncbi:putative signal recognition particle protein [Leptomonas seymouri]|uniref:Signal recognition particle subunit SRP72 n=1 Tax=Leptomonas seymouri TaxID=5684 RepID=A0A0N1I027_LEPSE|nr:putative signal recognition particle protein [Leptomonas seymouri]|eukprot:KPI83892.1 putative signal recognition particle protein [Leptomonas seymouri]
MSDISKLENALRKQTSSADVEPSKIVSTAERILSLQPHHIYAMQCTSVALLHAGKFAAALRVFEELEKEKAHVKAPVTFFFNKAYCYYRLLQYNEAKSTLRRYQGTATFSMRHLLAQIHYNLEEYAEAAAMYAALLEDGACADEVEKHELLTNYTAALSLSDPSKVAAVFRDVADEKTPDLLFNLAVAQLEAQDYEGARSTLLLAEQLCAKDFPKSSLHSLQEALAAEPEVLRAQLGLPLVASSHAGVGDSANSNSAERSFFNEVSSNWVQQAYVWFLQHREAESRLVMELILTYKPASAVTNAVAAILWTALQRCSDVFDSNRRLKSAQDVKLVPRLTSRQIIAVQYNTALLHLSTGALDRCSRTVEQMEKSFPNSELTQSLRLVLAVRELKRKKGSSAPLSSLSGDNVSAVQEFVRRYESEVTHRHGANSPSEANRKRQHRFIQMIAAQLFLEQGDVVHAIEAVEGVDDVDFLHRTATVVTLAAWKAQSGDTGGAMQLLKRRLTSSAAGGLSTEVKKAMLLWAVHDLAVGRGLYMEVGQLLKEIRSVDAALARDREVAALLVVCMAESNVAEAKKHIAALDEAAAAIITGAGSSSTKALSEQEVHARVREHPGHAAMNELGYRRVTAADQEATADGVEGEQPGLCGPPSRRRRAMRRPAKNMVGKPDPERWIPMPVRSYIKDLPERRKKELKRLRAIEQEQKRRAAAARQKKAVEGATVSE